MEAEHPPKKVDMLVEVAISAASLFIAVRQNALMEKQLSASTWPVLEYDTSNLDDLGNPVFTQLYMEA
jgi:hypothetical protein